jgi:hypothetical protein
MTGGIVPFVWKQYRFELVSIVIAIAVLTVVAAANAVLLNQAQPSLVQLGVCTATDNSLEAPDCANVGFWLSLRDTEIFRLLGAMPLVAGIVLGSVLVSREIEHRSAELGWSLSGSRTTWLMERVIPVGIVLVVLLAALGVAAESLEAARYPEVDPRSSLHEFGNRGPLLVMRGLAAFGIAVLAGAVAGRQLPALLLSGALVVVLAYGLAWTFPYGTNWQWVPRRKRERQAQTSLIAGTGRVSARRREQSSPMRRRSRRHRISMTPVQQMIGSTLTSSPLNGC